MSTEKFTPAELLETAEQLYKTGESKMYRAAILEAITALETYIATNILSKLNTRVGKEFSDWLDEKTRFDFDSRLGVLTSFVTRVKIDKQSKLWNDYKKAKQIRNNVTHTGKRVTKDQGRFVINTVYEWVEFLNQAQDIKDEGKGKDKSASDLLGQLVQASARLERLIYSALMKFESGKIDPRRVFRVEELLRLGLIDESTLTELHKLRELRNRAVHSHSLESIRITPTDVEKLNSLVDMIEKKL